MNIKSDERSLELLGDEAARVLNLRFDENGLVLTQWGRRSRAGLGSAIIRMVEDCAS